MGFVSQSWLDRVSERVYAVVCVFLAALWLRIFLNYKWDWELGVSAPAFSVLFLFALGFPWWWHHRMPYSPKPVPKPTPATASESKSEPEAAEESDDDAFTAKQRALWEKTVAHVDGPLPKSRLAVVERIPDLEGAWRGDIEILRGDNSRATAALPAIGAALNLKAGGISIEPPIDGAFRMAQILVIPNSPLQKIVRWDKPTIDPKTGVSQLGVYADSKPTFYRHWREGYGPVHDLISGTTGSGKSETTTMLVTEELNSGLVVPWVIDPQSGQSLPDLQNTVEKFARNILEARELLRDAVMRMFARNEFMASLKWVDERGRERQGLGSFTPGDPRHGLPIISITIDEAHMVLSDPECKASVEILGAMSRKCGLKIRLITQVPLLSSLGGSMAIRDAVASGNVIILRTGNRLTGQVAFNGGMPAVDPCLLPSEWSGGATTAGLGYFMGPGASRPVPFRASYADDAYGWALHANELNPITNRRIAAVIDDLKQRSSGDPMTSPDGSISIRPVSAAQGEVDAKESPESRRTGERAALMFLAARADRPDGVDRGDLVEGISAEFRGAEMEPPALRTLTKALKDLKERGLVVNPDRGFWMITAEGRVAARALGDEAGSDEPETEAAGGDRPYLNDEQLIDAIEMIVSTQFGSTSMLQRKLRRGHEDCVGLMEELQRLGVVGPAAGSAAREVKVTPQALEEVLADVREKQDRYLAAR
jgi:DNA segregation ATPase FtsK/SpoIIIE-like protein